MQACEILQLGQQSTTRSNPLEGLDLSKMSDEELICLYQTMATQPYTPARERLIDLSTPKLINDLL